MKIISMCDSMTGYFFSSLLKVISSLSYMNSEYKSLKRDIIDLSGKTVLNGNFIFFTGSIEAI